MLYLALRLSKKGPPILGVSLAAPVPPGVRKSKALHGRFLVPCTAFEAVKVDSGPGFAQGVPATRVLFLHRSTYHIQRSGTALENISAS